MRIILPIILLLSGVFWSSNLNSQVVINELMASMASSHPEYDFSSHCDWIELYNHSGQELDLSGWFLSDDVENPGMWEFQSGTILPSKEFLLIFADGTGNGMFTNFKLDKEGETVILRDPQFNIIDSLSYPCLRTDVSFGRSREKLDLFGYFTIATPGARNALLLLSGISAKPEFSLEGGFYPGPVSVEISTSSPFSRITYSLDGSTPTEASAMYEDPIEIAQTTVLRVFAHEVGKLPALVATHSYFIDEPRNLPVVSIVTDPEHFFSDETGIYVKGTNGVKGYCTRVLHNVSRDWERPANIELIEMDGIRALNQLAGVKIFGGCSRTRQPMKSLAFFARKEYETTTFNYPLFPDKPNDSYDSFILRASGDDQPLTLFRDALAQMVVKDVIDVDVQAYRPVVVYINGAYWGIHNLREKTNEHYTEDNFGVDADSVDMIEKNPETPKNVISGSADHYNDMIAYLEANDITQDVHYEFIKTQMDVDEYLNYQIIQIFVGANDWPVNNIKYWRSQEEPYDRWRWVLFDLDHTFKDPFRNVLSIATEPECNCRWPNPPWSTYLFRSLLENETFKNEFIQRFALYSGTHFSRERVHQFIDKMQAELAPEIPRHIERWGGQKTNLPEVPNAIPVFNSVTKWEENVDVMRNFTDLRHELALKYVNDYFGINGIVRVNTNLEPAQKGSLKIGGAELPGNVSSAEYGEGELLSVQCTANSGYIFSHWAVHTPKSTDSALIARGDQWSYIVSRSAPGPDWTAVDYDDSFWESGMAQLGYGDGDEVTEVGYGGDPDNKFITSWFRKNLIIEDSSLYRRYTLYLLRDDGARVFVNGLEVIRDNMMGGLQDSATVSEIPVDGADETIWHKFHLNPALFNNGKNVIAVEIHQADTTSSDMSFDLELLGRSSEPGLTDTITGKDLEIELLQDMEITAVLVKDTSVYEDLYINEIMASNGSGFVDETGAYEDWIEFFNGGEEQLDLAGLYLADTLDGPGPWLFPADQPELTSIDPDGYLVVFADNDEEDGPLHANFKLGKEGEEVVLLQKVGEEMVIIDRMVFEDQTRDISFGRYPDGGIMFEYMSETSPGATNRYTIAALDPDPVAPSSLAHVTVYPVPTRGLLHIRFNETLPGQNLPVSLKVYSLTGSVVHNSSHQSASQISLSLAQQPEGIYMLHITTGTRVYMKQVVVQ
ncbi:MAG: T9SS type A sorting domain-containing protein [Bacteroidetes bacterium]|nr:T9SS type A sorting domain-containing protein [Bacteroidota bacterium]